MIANRTKAVACHFPPLDGPGKYYTRGDHTVQHPAGLLFKELCISGNVLKLQFKVEKRSNRSNETAVVVMWGGGFSKCRCTADLTLPALPNGSIEDTVTVEGMLHCLLAARRQLLNLSKQREDTLAWVDAWIRKLCSHIPEDPQIQAAQQNNVSCCVQHASDQVCSKVLSLG